MKTRLRISLFMGLLSFAGCGDDDLPDFSKLDRLRVIAITASQPEVSPGTNVTITPYVSDLNGAGRALTFSAAACIDPGVSYGAEPTCDGNASRVALATSQALTTLAAPNYTGAADTFATTVPLDTIVFAGRSEKDQFNGVSWLVTYEVSAAGGPTVKSFKRILVSAASKASKNANPTITDILADGATLATFPAVAVRLSSQIGAGSAEAYELESSLGRTSKTETLTTTWFVTDGEMKYIRTQSGETSQWTPGSAPTGRNAIVIGVLRDDRGGAAVTQKTL